MSHFTHAYSYISRATVLLLVLLFSSGCAQVLIPEEVDVARQIGSRTAGPTALWIYTPPIRPGEPGGIVSLTVAPTSIPTIRRNSGTQGDSCSLATATTVTVGSPLGCLVSTILAEELDVASALHTFLTSSPNVRRATLSCSSFMELYRSALQPNYICERDLEVFHVSAQGEDRIVLDQGEILRRSGFQRRRASPSNDSGTDIAIVGDIFDAESIVFARFGIVGQINVSMQTGQVVDAEIVFLGEQ